MRHCEYLPEGNYRIDARPTSSARAATSGRSPCSSSATGRRSSTAWASACGRYEAALATLSSNTVHVIASRSGHYIHEDPLRLFDEAVREDVEAARSGSPLPPCEDAFPALDGECV